MPSACRKRGCSGLRADATASWHSCNCSGCWCCFLASWFVILPETWFPDRTYRKGVLPRDTLDDTWLQGTLPWHHWRQEPDAVWLLARRRGRQEKELRPEAEAAWGKPVHDNFPTILKVVNVDDYFCSLGNKPSISDSSNRHSRKIPAVPAFSENFRLKVW